MSALVEGNPAGLPQSDGRPPRVACRIERLRTLLVKQPGSGPIRVEGEKPLFKHEESLLPPRISASRLNTVEQGCGLPQQFNCRRATLQQPAKGRLARKQPYPQAETWH